MANTASINYDKVKDYLELCGRMSTSIDELPKASKNDVLKTLETLKLSNGFPANFDSDIRKLEGYLHKVMFYAFNNLPPNSIITISTVQAATEVADYNEIKDIGYSVDPQIVIDQICSTYGVDPKQVKSKSRKQQISNARQVCQYVLRKKFAMPYEEIGTYFGNRNHSTIIESINKIEKTLQNDENLKNYIEKIYKNI